MCLLVLFRLDSLITEISVFIQVNQNDRHRSRVTPERPIQFDSTYSSMCTRRNVHVYVFLIDGLYQYILYIQQWKFQIKHTNRIYVYLGLNAMISCASNTSYSVDTISVYIISSITKFEICNTEVKLKIKQVPPHSPSSCKGTQAHLGL